MSKVPERLSAAYDDWADERGVERDTLSRVVFAAGASWALGQSTMPTSHTEQAIHDRIALDVLREVHAFLIEKEYGEAAREIRYRWDFDDSPPTRRITRRGPTGEPMS